MAEAKRGHDWMIASHVMALMATVAPFKKRAQKFKPADFNPMAKPAKPMKTGITTLKDVFIDRRVNLEPRE